MAQRLTWSPTARDDLTDLLSYISQADPEAARRFAAAIFRTVERLVRFPKSGRIVPEFQDPTIRETVLRPCRVVYRIMGQGQEIEIARIWHAARGRLEI